MAEDKGASSSTFTSNQAQKELELIDVKCLQKVQSNLDRVRAGLMKCIPNTQEQNQADLPDKHFLSILKRTVSNINETVPILTKQIDAKVRQRECVLFISMADKLRSQMEENVENTIARRASIRAELAQKKKEFNETHEAIWKYFKALPRVDHDPSMTDKDNLELLAQIEKKVLETLAKRTSIKAELFQMKKKYDETQEAITNYIADLDRVEHGVIERFKHLQLEETEGDD